MEAQSISVSPFALLPHFARRGPWRSSSIDFFANQSGN